MRVGSKDKAKKEYDLVFEDQIDFIMDKVEVGDIEVRFPAWTRVTSSGFSSSAFYWASHVVSSGMCINLRS